MQKFKFLLYLLSAVILTGCGQTVVETLQITDRPNPNAPGRGQTILILPFADYTAADDLAGAYRRNLTISEALTDRLVANGFGMVVQEDIFGYLVEEKIINLVSYDGNVSDSIAAELTNEWSETMKGILQGYQQNLKKQGGMSVTESPGTHALNQNALAKMGRKFNADYVVRGRILEYKTRQEATWIPWKRGVLPIISGGSSRILNGFAGSDSYDERNESLSGMLLGGIIGYNYTTLPWNDGQTFMGMADDSGNTVFWGATGAALGRVAHTSGQVDQAAVQMRIWVQEAATGNVIWTNRVRVLVSPESVFADNQYDTLFNLAIEKGVGTLVDNFISYGL
jgi:hypothetical protein